MHQNAKLNFYKKKIDKDKTKNNKAWYWLFGYHAVKAALANERRQLYELVVTKASYEAILKDTAMTPLISKKLNALDITVCSNQHDFAKKTGFIENNHQYIAMKTAFLHQLSLESLLQNDRKQKVLILDQINDPHNIGAIFRTAAAFAIDAIITTRDNSPRENATIAKVACGGLENVHWITVSNLKRSMTILKNNNYYIIGLDGSAEYDISHLTRFTPSNMSISLVLGNEEKGMRRLTEETCDLLVQIPIVKSINSLNVSNAAAIALYAINR